MSFQYAKQIEGIECDLFFCAPHQWTCIDRGYQDQKSWMELKSFQLSFYV